MRRRTPARAATGRKSPLTALGCSHASRALAAVRLRAPRRAARCDRRACSAANRCSLACPTRQPATPEPARQRPARLLARERRGPARTEAEEWPQCADSHSARAVRGGGGVPGQGPAPEAVWVPVPRLPALGISTSPRHWHLISDHRRPTCNGYGLGRAVPADQAPHSAVTPNLPARCQYYLRVSCLCWPLAQPDAAATKAAHPTLLCAVLPRWLREHLAAHCDGGGGRQQMRAAR